MALYHLCFSRFFIAFWFPLAYAPGASIGDSKVVLTKFLFCQKFPSTSPKKVNRASNEAVLSHIFSFERNRISGFAFKSLKSRTFFMVVPAFLCAITGRPVGAHKPWKFKSFELLELRVCSVTEVLSKAPPLKRTCFRKESKSFQLLFDLKFGTIRSESLDLTGSPR